MSTRLLVVDDNPGYRRLVRLALEDDQAFAVVAEAGSAPEAIAIAVDARPEVALVDVLLPDGQCVLLLDGQPHRLLIGEGLDAPLPLPGHHVVQKNSELHRARDSLRAGAPGARALGKVRPRGQEEPHRVFENLVLGAALFLRHAPQLFHQTCANLGSVPSCHCSTSLPPILARPASPARSIALPRGSGLRVAQLAQAHPLPAPQAPPPHNVAARDDPEPACEGDIAIVAEHADTLRVVPTPNGLEGCGLHTAAPTPHASPSTPHLPQ